MLAEGSGEEGPLMRVLGQVDGSPALDELVQS